MAEPYAADVVRSGEAFDAAAAGYDAHFTESPLGRALRESVWRVAADRLATARHILELGCGTGADFARLTASGARVTAIDGSAQMCEIARDRAGAEGLGGRVSVRHADLNDPSTALRALPNDVDALWTNFGVMNAIRDRVALSRRLGALLPPGAPLVAVVMGPVCLSEIGWHLSSLRPRVAFRRFRNGAPAHAGGGKWVPVWYPSPTRLSVEFAPDFIRREIRGAGIALPPSYAASRWARHGWFRRVTTRLEASLQPMSALAAVADHYVACFERRHR